MTCSDMIDYSTVSGERILPFQFTLNTEKSVLEPQEGEHQIFCYDVEGVGEDRPQFADLSHFLLGICKDITREDILSVTVKIDGKEQEVVWGENVEIKTEEKPDPPTGCAGLKIDFGLDKVDGEMEVCITMASPFAVGPVVVCVFGGNVTATGLAICGPVCGEEPGCDKVFFQRTNVCVPVTVKPFATPGEANVRCCGRPVVASRDTCPGTNESCKFTVTQELCIEIPITFGADVMTGDARVQCGEVSTMPCDCDDTETAPEETVESLLDSIGLRGVRRRR
ncbi:MAG: hypothetical protein KH828_05040 [Clostridiales bacterium]|nr:hypothetical protein [Clostridiales bacterium]